MGNVRKKVVGFGKHLFMVLISAFMIFPLLWGLRTSLKPRSEIFTYPPKWFSGITLENYGYSFEKLHLGKYIVITLGLTVTATVLGIIFAACAAYVFSRYNFRGKAFLSAMVVCPMLIPGIVNLIPLFSVFTKIGLVDSFWGLVILYIPAITPFSVMVLQNYLRSVPFTLEEAAMIDGCNRIQLLTKIIFPVIMPGMVAVSMISFVSIWNEFIITLIFTTGGKMRTATLTLYYLIGNNRVNYGVLCAVSFVIIIPVLVIFLIFRKQFISSMLDGAVKG